MSYPINNPKMAHMLEVATRFPIRERATTLSQFGENPTESTLSLADYLVIAAIMSFPVMVLLSLVLANQM